MKKWTKATLAAVALAGSLSAVATAASTANAAARKASGPVNGGTLTIAQMGAFNPNFIPLLDASTYTAEVWSLAFDPLMTVDKNFKYGPWLAKSYTWSKDKKSLTMELQPNANWSDGKPITSDDVLFYMDYLASKEYNTVLQGGYESNVDPVIGADEIMAGKKTSFAQTGGFTKVSDKKFTIHFKTADAAVLTADVAGYTPLPKHVLQSVPLKDWATCSFARKPTVVSGPYQFVNVNGTDSVEMKANTKYWKGRPHIDNVVWKTASVDVQPGLLAKGDIDLILNGVRAADMNKYKAMPNVNTVTSPGMNFSYIGMKLDKPEFKDVRVRQAFMYAIDRKAIVNGIQKGYAEVLNSPVPAASWAAASQKDGLNPYDYNLAKAGKLLDQAGWKKGKDGWRIDPVTGKTADLFCESTTGSPVGTLITTAFIQDMAKVGIKVHTTAEDFNVVSKKVQTDDKSIYFWSGMAWSLGVDPDPRGLWGSDNPLNFGNFKDKTNDALIAKTFAPAAFDQSVRKKALVAWQLDINRKVPMLFLYQRDNTWAMSNRLHIPAADVASWDLVNIQDWWLQ